MRKTILLVVIGVIGVFACLIIDGCKDYCCLDCDGINYYFDKHDIVKLNFSSANEIEDISIVEKSEKEHCKKTYFYILKGKVLRKVSNEAFNSFLPGCLCTGQIFNPL